MIPLLKPSMPDKGQLLPALERSLYEGPLNEGDAVYEFEEKLGQMLGANALISVNSGTAALHLALILSGVVAGDEVLTTSLTAEPTNTVITQAGATPIFVDLFEDGQLDLEDLKNKVTERTRAIIVVHYGGYPQSLTKIKELVDGSNIKIIEDCAHALFSQMDGLNCGLLGDFGCYSFQAIKQITTVEGGALVLRDRYLIEEAKQRRWFGLSKGLARESTKIVYQGFKYNFNNVAATIGLIQLSTVKDRVRRVQEIAAAYDACIDQLKYIDRVVPIQNSRPSYWLYSVLCDETEGLISLLRKCGISSGKIHKLNHEHPIFTPRVQLTGAEKFHRRLLHIPIGPWLRDEEIDKIIEGLHHCDGELGR